MSGNHSIGRAGAHGLSMRQVTFPAARPVPVVAPLLLAFCLVLLVLAVA